MKSTLAPLAAVLHQTITPTASATAHFALQITKAAPDPVFFRNALLTHTFNDSNQTTQERPIAGEAAANPSPTSTTEETMPDFDREEVMKAINDAGLLIMRILQYPLGEGRAGTIDARG